MNRYNLTKSVQKLTDQKGELEDKLTMLRKQLREIKMEHQHCMLQQQRLFEQKWETLLKTIQVSRQELQTEMEQIQKSSL